MGRHSMQAAADDEGGRLAPVKSLREVIARRRAVPSGEPPDADARPGPVASFREMIAHRRRAVLGGAAAVVTVLALGGVATLAEGFAPEDRSGCTASGCVADQADGTDAARPTASSTPSTAGPSHTTSPRNGTHHTFEPTTVRQPLRTRPSAEPRPHRTRAPRPPGHGHHRPPHHWQWHWPW